MQLLRIGKTKGIFAPAPLCEAMQLFAATVMPQFKVREAEHEAKKAVALAPYIEAALARKQWMQPIAKAAIPVMGPYGRTSSRRTRTGPPTSRITEPRILRCRCTIRWHNVISTWWSVAIARSWRTV